MPVFLPPGTITNFGTFNKNLHLTVRNVYGYQVLAPPEKQTPIVQFLFYTIVEDAIIAYGGSAMLATETGTRLARLASMVAQAAARAAKPAKTAVQSTKVVKQATQAMKMLNQQLKRLYLNHQ